jgi:hypothetical protein
MHERYLEDNRVLRHELEERTAAETLKLQGARAADNVGCEPTI